MDISIIIPNYNRVHDVIDCIKSMADQSLQPLEIIIVDDGSSDGSVEKIRAQFPSVKVIENPRNLGPGFARNNGILHARGDHVLFLDSDTKFSDRDTLANFAAFYKAHPDAGCVGGEIRATSADLTRVYGKMTAWDGMSYDASLQRTRTDSHVKCDYLATCCCMVSRQLSLDIGGFDPWFSYGGEDKDFGYRVEQKGYTNYLVNNCAVSHYHSPSGRNSDETYRFRMTGLRFVIKNYPTNNTVLTLLKYILMFLRFYLLLPFKALWLIMRKQFLKKENLQGGYYYLKSIFKCMADYAQIRASAKINFLSPEEMNRYIKYRS